jgi:SAM-dependent methyltransferase
VTQTDLMLNTRSDRAGLFYVFRDAYGDDYPEEAQPHSFVTKTDLARIGHLLAVGPGSVLVDLGCGRGGPGLWLARETGADLIGIDLSPDGIQQASQYVAEFGLVGRARFLQGDVCATALPDQSCDGAVSIYVVVFIPDKPAVMRKAARILRPGAFIVLLAIEGSSEFYRPLLSDSGFRVEVYEEMPDWRCRRLILYERILAEQAALIEELGDGSSTIIEEARQGLADGLVNARHVLILGRRT